MVNLVTELTIAEQVISYTAVFDQRPRNGIYQDTDEVMVQGKIKILQVEVEPNIDEIGSAQVTLTMDVSDLVDVDILLGETEKFVYVAQKGELTIFTAKASPELLEVFNIYARFPIIEVRFITYKKEEIQRVQQEVRVDVHPEASGSGLNKGASSESTSDETPSALSPASSMESLSSVKSAKDNDDCIGEYMEKRHPVLYKLMGPSLKLLRQEFRGCSGWKDTEFKTRSNCLFDFINFNNYFCMIKSASLYNLDKIKDWVIFEFIAKQDYSELKAGQQWKFMKEFPYIFMEIGEKIMSVKLKKVAILI